MKKAASIFLRADMNLQDVRLLIHWMENPAVTRYLNEAPDIVSGLRQLADMVPARCTPRWQRPFCSAGHGGSLPGFTRKICGQSVLWPPAASAAWKQDGCTDLKLPCRTI